MAIFVKVIVESKIITIRPLLLKVPRHDNKID